METAMIGYMAMPDNFKYKSVYLRGKPNHSRDDVFYHRHPSMPSSQRAKIFAPFDALAGFGDAISAKETLYEERHDMSEDETYELDMKLRALAALTVNGRTARKNAVMINVTYFLPCRDENSDVLKRRGKYISLKGICMGIDAGKIRIMTGGKERRVPINDVMKINGSKIDFAE